MTNNQLIKLSSFSPVFGGVIIAALFVIAQARIIHGIRLQSWVDVNGLLEKLLIFVVITGALLLAAILMSMSSLNRIAKIAVGSAGYIIIGLWGSDINVISLTSGFEPEFIFHLAALSYIVLILSSIIYSFTLVFRKASMGRNILFANPGILLGIGVILQFSTFFGTRILLHFFAWARARPSLYTMLAVGLFLVLPGMLYACSLHVIKQHGLAQQNTETKSHLTDRRLRWCSMGLLAVNTLLIAMQ